MRHGMQALRGALGLLSLVLVAACASDPSAPSAIADTFVGPNGLIAAPGRPRAAGEPWELTSGTLFRADNTGWSGVPDDGRAEGSNGSAVFRMVSYERAFGNVDMTVTLRVDGLVETDRTPAQDYDGAHIWVRYRSDAELYAVSVDRRDGTMIIKKKCPGGDTNGGTYHDLSESVRDAPIPFGAWQRIVVTVRNQPDGSVAVDATRDGHSVRAVDTGVGCRVIPDGGVGVRGDNADLRLGSVIVQPV